jgi:hypothetical protein
MLFRRRISCLWGEAWETTTTLVPKKDTSSMVEIKFDQHPQKEKEKEIV